jgi:hypothetical protein
MKNLGIISFVKMESSKLINYSTNMCFKKMTNVLWYLPTSMDMKRHIYVYIHVPSIYVMKSFELCLCFLRKNEIIIPYDHEELNLNNLIKN